MTSPLTATTPVDFSALYDGHHEYSARRLAGSFSAQIVLETTAFKIPQLSALLRPDVPATSVMEIGCATGELIGHSRVVRRQVLQHVRQYRHCKSSSRCVCPAASTDLQRHRRFDYIICRDVLEHVEDHPGLLRPPPSKPVCTGGSCPLEDNSLNRNRAYGPDDVSGHLRRYSLADGLALFERAGLDVAAFVHVWAHEQPFDTQRRALRSTYHGQPYSGGRTMRAAKVGVNALVRTMPSLGRRLYRVKFICSCGTPRAVTLRADMIRSVAIQTCGSAAMFVAVVVIGWSRG